MKTLRIAGLVIAVVISPLVASADSYSLADLEALDKQESWQELLVHSGDVPPTQRNDKWTQMVERAALGTLSSHSGEADAAWTFADAAVHQYPQLKKSKKYMAARAQADLRGLEACLQKPGPVVNGRRTPPDITSCIDRTVTSAETDPSDAETSFAMAKMIERAVPSAAVRVYKRALSGRHTAKDCSAKELGRSVTDALMLAPEDTRVPDAQSIAFDVCWDGLQEAVIDRFIAESSSKNYRKNTCSYLLAKKDALSPLSRKQCESLK
jgi:hypothetical protein